MSTAIKILLVEHDLVDIDLIHHELKKDGILYISEVVQTEPDYVNALKTFIPDIILSDFTLPAFSGFTAFNIKEKLAPNTPFIIVTGTIGEEKSVDLIKSGVTDYALKEKLFTLTPKIKRALKESKERKLKNKKTQELIQSEEKYRTLVDQAFDGIIIYTTEGVILDCNHTACDYIGYTKKELKTHIIQDLFFKEDLLVEPLYFETLETGQPSFDLRKLKRKDGSFLEMEIITKMMPDGNLMAIARDITEKKKAEEERRKLAQQLFEQQQKEQLKITATALEAQERERTAIGQELHDNVNQILAATKMQIKLIKCNSPDISEALDTSINYIQQAIDENRRIAHALVTPDLKMESLEEQLKALVQSMLGKAGIKINFSARSFKEELLDNPQKIAVYRIAQEQCSNIIKYAVASSVTISLITSSALFTMVIADDGQGVEKEKKNEGIGLRNINSRLSVFYGSSKIDTAPGKGFKLEIEIPLKESKSNRSSTQVHFVG